MISPGNVSLAADALASKLDEYRHPYWMKSDFGAAKLIADFGKAGTLTVDFDIKIDSGFSLLHKKHRPLLEDIYLWLGLQSHRDAIGDSSRSGSEEAHRRAVLQTLALVDYFLIRAREHKLAQYGFSAISGNQLRQLLVDLAEKRDSHEWIYKWRENLNAFIGTISGMVSASEVEKALEAAPEIRDIAPDQQDIFRLQFDDEQIVRARVFLYTHGMYTSNNGADYAWRPNTSALAEVFYGDMLRGAASDHRWPIPLELCWRPHPRYRRECPNASVVEEETDQAVSEKHFDMYRRRLLTLRQLSKCGRGPSLSTLDAVTKFNYRDALKLKPPGRTFTLPPDYVLQCMGTAIGFYVEHGEHLLSSYLNVLQAAKRARVSLKTFANANDITKFCTTKTLEMGVKVFSLKAAIGHESHKRRSKTREPRASNEEFFLRLRRCEGLLECVQVLFGAISFVVGTLMAARNSEMEGLPIEECLSETQRWLTLLTAKSGTPRIRRPDARPIPEICAKMVALLQQFHSNCESAGMKTKERLFTTGRGNHTDASYVVLDLFIDFIDAPKLDDGSRYYVRQHMLRRFFAVVFFLSAGLEGLRPLRWMLRHLDMRHLYNYISASIPGAILRTIKSVAVATMVRAGADDYLELAEYLKRNLGTARFDVMSEKELASYIDSLQLDGTVEIEPVFLDHSGKRRFRIGVQIWEREHLTPDCSTETAR